MEENSYYEYIVLICVGHKATQHIVHAYESDLEDVIISKFPEADNWHICGKKKIR